MPKRKYVSKSSYLRKRLKPGMSPFLGLKYSRSTQLRTKLNRARNLGLKNARTGGLLGVETKYLDTAIGSVVLTSPADASGGEVDPTAIGCVGCLSAPAQGDTASNREGFKIVAKSMQVEGNIMWVSQANQTAADVAGIVFVALVLDTQTNGAQLNSEDVFTNPSAQPINCVTPLRNMSYTERFKVLKIKKLICPSLPVTYDGTNIEQAGAVRSFKMFVNLNALPIKFTSGSTTANVSGVVDNSLHLIAYTTDAGSLNPVISYNARMRFVG